MLVLFAGSRLRYKESRCCDYQVYSFFSVSRHRGGSSSRRRAPLFLFFGPRFYLLFDSLKFTPTCQSPYLGFFHPKAPPRIWQRSAQSMMLCGPAKICEVPFASRDGIWGLGVSLHPGVPAARDLDLWVSSGLRTSIIGCIDFWV